MIDLSKYLIFENNKKTFKETSKDDHDGSITYMTESQYQVISFDDVKDMNDEGKFEYDYDLDNEYSNLSTLGKIWYIIKNIISTVFPFALFVWIAVMCTKPEFGYKDNKKIDKNNTPMFRDIPCNKDNLVLRMLPVSAQLS